MQNGSHFFLFASKHYVFVSFPYLPFLFFSFIAYRYFSPFLYDVIFLLYCTPLFFSFIENHYFFSFIAHRYFYPLLYNIIFLLSCSPLFFSFIDIGHHSVTYNFFFFWGGNTHNSVPNKPCLVCILYCLGYVCIASYTLTH